MSSINKIVIVEDHTSWRNQFEKILRAMDETRDIIKIDFDGFNNHFKLPKDFDNIDYFFVDLELGPGSDSGLDDTWGLDIVLPRIRSLAPWIPVALISRYIAGQINLLCHLSVSDFDGIYPKQIISDGTTTHPEFNKKKWKDILQSLIVKRNASLTGRSVAKLKQLLNTAEKQNLTLSDDAKDAVGEAGRPVFQEALALLDFGGAEFSLDQIVTGFSGVYVAKIGVYGQNGNSHKKSFWLVKWGEPIRKLAEESNAHKRFQRQGIDRSLIVHQLYPNVINWGGNGFIVYGFEKDAQTAYERIQDGGIDSIIEILKKICQSLYSSSTPMPISPSELIKEWWKLDDCDYEIIKERHNINSTLEITKCIIHGDFHLRNILIHNDTPTLIDFARSRFAPISIDFAKIIIDTIVFFMLEETQIDSFRIDNLSETSIAPFISIFEPFLLSSDDRKFLEISMDSYALKYLKYPDVNNIAKDNIRKILNIQ